ncbi:rRNA processing protein [Rhodotorula kratochvilovae]
MSVLPLPPALGHPAFLPKSSKHKKDRKADFTKAKLKLGKGKQVANNATNTSFAAKSIALPNQSLAEAPKSAPVSRRNLTLPELLVQSRHYSVPVKREALHEISQLLDAHPFLLQQHLLPLVTSLAHLIGDESLSTRAAVRALLSQVAEALPAQSFVSVSPAIVLFTLSALSSLDDPVRTDALRILDLLLAHIPAELTRGFDPARPAVDAAEDAPTGIKVVAALLGLLKIRSAAVSAAGGAFTTSSTASDLAPHARLAVLGTLARFLVAAGARASGTEGAEDEPWFLARAFATEEAYRDWRAGVQPRKAPVMHVESAGTSAAVDRGELAFAPAPAEGALGPLSAWGIFTPPASPAAAAAGKDQPREQPTLLALLHPTLLSAFLDAAPSAFTPSLAASSASAGAGAQHLDTIAAVLSVARALFALALAGPSAATAAGSREAKEARKMLLGLLGHAGAYFPFGGADALAGATAGRAGAGDGDDERFMRLNLAFAELSSLLVLSSAGAEKGAKGKARGKEGQKVEGVVLERVQEWVVQALRGELTSPTHPLGLPLPAASFAALRPTLWALLNQPSHAQAQDVFAAAVAYFARASSAGGGEAKRASGEFVAWAVLIHSSPAYTAPFSLAPLAAQLAGLSPREQKANPLALWLAGVPKWLWELGERREDETELVLSVLLKLVQQAPKGLIPPQTLLALAPLLSPFFHLSHPSRGPIPGPFTKLPPRVQARALDLAALLLALDGPEGTEEGKDRLREAVRRAVKTKGVKEETTARWEALWV